MADNWDTAFSEYCDEATQTHERGEPDADDRYQLLAEEPSENQKDLDREQDYNSLTAQAERQQRRIDEWTGIKSKEE